MWVDVCHWFSAFGGVYVISINVVMVIAGIAVVVWWGDQIAIVTVVVIVVIVVV